MHIFKKNREYCILEWLACSTAQPTADTSATEKCDEWVPEAES